MTDIDIKKPWHTRNAVEKHDAAYQAVRIEGLSYEEAARALKAPSRNAISGALKDKKRQTNETRGVKAAPLGNIHPIMRTIFEKQDELKISINHLAEISGYSGTYISQLRTGKMATPRLNVVIDFANSVKLDLFIGDQNAE